MIKYYYSALYNGFFSDVIHDQLPKDSKEVPESDYIRIFESLSNGGVLSSDNNGNPVVKQYKLTDADLVKIERSWRDSELLRSDIEILKLQDRMKGFSLKAWREYRISLRDWPKHDKFPLSEFRPISPDK